MPPLGRSIILSPPPTISYFPVVPHLLTLLQKDPGTRFLQSCIPPPRTRGQQIPIRHILSHSEDSKNPLYAVDHVGTK